MRLNATAVIIAGGKSSRMQKDKALLPFGKYNTLSEYQFVRLSKIFENIYLSAKVNKFDFEVTVLEDNYSTSSPLVALISIFENLKEEEIFVLSVDAPFVSELVINQLYNEAKEGVDVIVAESTQGLEPLCAIYRKSFLKEAYAALNENRHRLQGLFSHLNVQRVKINDKEIFTNLNYLEEYQEASKRVR